jgi:hypothetical protein
LGAVSAIPPGAMSEEARVRQAEETEQQYLREYFRLRDEFINSFCDTYRDGWDAPEPPGVSRFVLNFFTFCSRQDVARERQHWPKQHVRRWSRKKRGPEQAPAWKCWPKSPQEEDD